MSANSAASVLSKAVDYALSVCFGLIGLWALVALFSAGYLRYAIPLSPDDIGLLSHLGLFSLEDQCLTVIVLFPAMVGIANLLERLYRDTGSGNTYSATTTLVLVSLLLWVGVSDRTTYLVALANGDARLGCFVTEARECREMLSLSTQGTQSMYQDGGKHRYADWYVASLTAKTGRAPTSLHAPLSSALPLFSLPVVAWRAQELAVALEAQRQDVQRLRAEVGPYRVPVPY